MGAMSSFDWMNQNVPNTTKQTEKGINIKFLRELIGVVNVDKIVSILSRIE